MIDRICTRKLTEERQARDFCRCLSCQEERLRMALEFYRKDLCPGPAMTDPFPEKGGISPLGLFYL
jgi:hypothetical protein